MISRPAIPDARRIVLKLGTSLVTGPSGDVDRDRIAAIADTVASLRSRGREVLVVSSGAVGIGAKRLGFPQLPTDLEERQACAAAGQGGLVAAYSRELDARGLVVGQLLLTEADFDDRARYLGLRGTLQALLRRGAVPLINENDVVSSAELAFLDSGSRPVFGDNDRLSALVAGKLEADLLVLLTDVDGVFDRDPLQEGARLIEMVDEHGVPSLAAAGGPGSETSRGGMRSKVEAAMMAARAGCHAVIASGRDASVLGDLLAGRSVGTWFPARDRLGARRRWIAFAAAPRGVLHLDAGAVRAVQTRGASLLAAGVARVDGTFDRGDVVELRGPDGTAVGRGIVFCDDDAARRWRVGDAPPDARNHHALVHRDHMALESDGGASGDGDEH